MLSVFSVNFNTITTSSIRRLLVVLVLLIGPSLVFSPYNSPTAAAQTDPGYPGFSGPVSAIAGLPTNGAGVEIRWQMSLSKLKTGFNLYRADKRDGSYVQVNPQLIAVAPLSQFKLFDPYSFVDTSGQPGQWYRVETIYRSGPTLQSQPFQAINVVLPPSTSAARPQTVRPKPTLPVYPQTPAMAGQAGLLKFFVDSTGIYRISYSELVAAGLDLSGHTGSQIHISGFGKSIQVATNTPGAIGPTSYFEIYAQSNSSLYSAEAAYFLSLDGQGPPVYTITNTNAVANLRRRYSHIIIEPGATNQSSPYLATTHFEVDDIYNPYAGDNHPWLWAGACDFDPSCTSPYDFPFTLTALPANPSTTAQAVVKVDFTAISSYVTDPHSVQFLLNGQPLGQPFNWTGFDSQNLSLRFPQSWLVTNADPAKPVTNTLTLSDISNSQLSQDSIALEYFDVSYTRLPHVDNNQIVITANPASATFVSGFTDSQLAAYDINDPTQPQRLNLPASTMAADGSYGVTLGNSQVGKSGLVTRSLSRSYFVAGSSTIKHVLNLAPDVTQDLRATSNAYDLVIISYSGFNLGNDSPAQKLAQLHSATLGQRTLVVNVDDIYDRFNFGNTDPQAIKDFLAYAHTKWKVAPKWVLLLGGAAINYKGYNLLNEDNSQLSLVPAHFFRDNIYYFRTASDGWYVAGSDGVTPFMSIGRLPAQTLSEANVAVTNITNYVRNPVLSGTWRSQANFVTDAYDAVGNPLPSPSYFDTDSNNIIANLPSNITANKYYAAKPDTVDGNGNFVAGDGLAAINAGALIVNYLGHGAIESWSAYNTLQSCDALVTTSATCNDPTTINHLTNGGERPLVVQLSCDVGDFTVVNDSLAWVLLTNPNGGAIASLAAAGFTDEAPDVLMGQKVYEQLLGQANLTLGEGVQKAMTNVVSQGTAYYNSAKAYNLIGDPAIYLNR